MGVFQLPDSVDGDAAGCLAYSFFCLLVNIILIWLIWTHHERTSCTLQKRERKKEEEETTHLYTSSESNHENLN